MTLFSRKKSAFTLLLSFFAVSASLGAQEATALQDLPGLRERAVVVTMISRIVEQDEEVLWNSEISSVTIPGRPVGIKLIGSNLVAAIQFTPFLRPNGRHILVTLGQIWINVPDEGISFHTTMQTIPLEYSEQVYFFPLGSVKDQDAPIIEIQLVLEPYFYDEEEQAGRERRRVTSP
ncbi:MAG: hypothetical protein LBQ94_02985 [Treponema sp.]|jgi:hypothetical protein|nr:hypothetical protein [Treponema sp.]